jgi:hypothetical protein
MKARPCCNYRKLAADDRPKIQLSGYLRSMPEPPSSRASAACSGWRPNDRSWRSSPSNPVGPGCNLDCRWDHRAQPDCFLKDRSSHSSPNNPVDPDCNWGWRSDYRAPKKPNQRMPAPMPAREPSSKSVFSAFARFPPSNWLWDIDLGRHNPSHRPLGWKAISLIAYSKAAAPRVFPAPAFPLTDLAPDYMDFGRVANPWHSQFLYELG